MPKYSYNCAECNINVDAYHSISELLTDCTHCGSLGSLQRRPSKFILFKEEEKNTKTGQVVKKSIEDFSRELKKEKEKLKNEFFEPDK